MATLDDLYTQLAQTKKTLSTLQGTLQQQTTTWNAAITQLKLPGSRPIPVSRPLVASKPGAPSTPAPTTPTAVYTVTDLPALATAVMQAQAACTASKAAMDAINAEIQTAIAAKG